MQSPDLISESQLGGEGPTARNSIPSPVTRGAAAARISSAESTKASAAARISSAESTTRAAAKTAATTKQIAQNHAGQETTPTTAASPAAGPHEPEQDEQSAQDDGPRNGISRGALHAAWQLSIERDILDLGYGRSDGLRRRHNGLPVLALPESGSHFAQNAAGKTIGDQGLEAIANFHAAAPIVDNQQQHDPFVFAFVPDAPGAKNRVCHILDGLALERG